MANDNTVQKIKLDPNISILDLIEQYPEVVDVLESDFEFHCVNCIFSDFDTLEAGASLHGIEGDDFQEMLMVLEEVINSK
jgi:hybrid cluster-associated redox disulfide protein